MNPKFIKSLAKYSLIFGLVGSSNMANAHIYNTGLMINKTTQVLTLNCPAGSARLAAQVLDGTSNNGVMSVTIFKDGNAQTTSDMAQGNSAYGAYVRLSAGSGVYYMVASQTSAVTGTYKIQYHCEDAQGAETTLGTATLTQQ